MQTISQLDQPPLGVVVFITARIMVATSATTIIKTKSDPIPYWRERPPDFVIPGDCTIFGVVNFATQYKSPVKTEGKAEPPSKKITATWTGIPGHTWNPAMRHAAKTNPKKAPTKSFLGRDMLSNKIQTAIATNSPIKSPFNTPAQTVGASHRPVAKSNESERNTNGTPRFPNAESNAMTKKMIRSGNTCIVCSGRSALVRK